MTKLGTAALVAVFAALVLAAGPDRRPDAHSTTQLRGVDRGHVIAHKLADRRASAARADGATSVR
jgi:hypothetical protein